MSFADHYRASLSRVPAHAREVVASALSSGRRQSHGDEESTCNATGKQACALKRFHLFFFSTYTERSTQSWRRGCSPNVVSAARVNTLEHSNLVQRKAMQCKSVGNQPLETVIDVARNASTLRAVFAPREIRARLCKILQRRSRTTIVQTCPEYQRMLEK